jgi:TPR repeat protein
MRKAKLGIFICQWLGVNRYYEKAVHWWRQSALQNNAAAEYSLGLIYGEGKGVPAKDKSMAMAWLARAAQHVDRTATATLGLIFWLRIRSH